MNYFKFLFKKIMKYSGSLFTKFALKSKTNKDKSTEIFPPLLRITTYICAGAIPRGKKGQQKVPIKKKDHRALCPSCSYYSITYI